MSIATRPGHGRSAASPSARARRRSASLSPLAARSYPALRARAEEDCALRTPFQRDRDRIVHSKAFRRLTHKTQVFVAPEGDHYRTRLTHTLEVTTISRTVARALRLNEDLVEAIGLGHDLGHPPFGHIGEEVLDRCLRERFGGGLSPLRALAARRRSARARRRRAEPDRAGARRDRPPLQPRAAAADAGGADRAGDRPRRLHQPRHRRRGARRAAARGRAARASRSRCSAPAARRGSTRSCTTWSSTPRRPGDIVQGAEAGAAMGELRDFMFERVYLGPAVRAEHEQHRRGRAARLFEHYVEHPELLPARAPRAARATEERAGASASPTTWRG